MDRKIKWISAAICLLFITTAFSGAGYQDTTPPVTTHELDPPVPDGCNDWYVSDVTVTLTATDDDSGVDYTKYRIDSSLWEIYTSPFTVTSEGVHIVEYYSVDNAGNKEVHKSVDFKIDKTDPIVSITTPIAGCLYIFGMVITCSLPWTIIIGPITITATADDATSGIDIVEFYIDGGLRFPDGVPPYEWLWDETVFFMHTITVIAHDEACNSAIDVINVFIFNI